MIYFGDYQLENKTFSFLLAVYNFLQDSGLKNSEIAKSLIENAGIVGITFTDNDEMSCSTRNQKILNCKIAAEKAVELLKQLECDDAFNPVKASLIEEAAQISEILNNFVEN